MPTYDSSMLNNVFVTLEVLGKFSNIDIVNAIKSHLSEASSTSTPSVDLQRRSWTHEHSDIKSTAGCRIRVKTEGKSGRLVVSIDG